MAKEQEQLAVLFADVCGSTALYRELGDVSDYEIIGACLAQASEIVPRYRGRRIKTIGDALMCVFPSADESLLAASDILATIANNPPRGHRTSMHVGLHYGSVISAEGDVYGDTVNAASYLTAVAGADQILLTAATEACLSPALKASLRPLFHATLKGSAEELPVYQMLWRTDAVELTNVNLSQHRFLPADRGSLLLTCKDRMLRIDHQRGSVQIGRNSDCDFVLTDMLASRVHASVHVQRTSFYLVDQSTNGTFVLFDSGEEIHVLRNELRLQGAGKISAGLSFNSEPHEFIEFRPDRRALYRV